MKISKELKEKSEEFNKYFQSGNSVDVDAYIRVKTADWREIYKLIQDAEEA